MFSITKIKTPAEFLLILTYLYLKRKKNNRDKKDYLVACTAERNSENGVWEKKQKIHPEKPFCAIFVGDSLFFICSI